MPDWYSEYIYLIVGVIALSGAVVSTCNGKTLARGRLSTLLPAVRNIRRASCIKAMEQLTWISFEAGSPRHSKVMRRKIDRQGSNQHFSNLLEILQIGACFYSGETFLT